MIKLLSIDLDVEMDNKYYRGVVAAKLAVNLWNDLYSHLPLFFTLDEKMGNRILYMEDKTYLQALVDPLLVNKDYQEITPTIILMNILSSWNECVKKGWANSQWDKFRILRSIYLPDPPIIAFW